LIHSEAKTYFFGCHDIVLLTEENTLSMVSRLSEYFNYPYLLDEDAWNPPAWVSSTVWYSIFPDRFRPRSGKTGGTHAFGLHVGKPSNDQFYGGDVQGVIEAIPYLQELGVNGIYFTPIFKAYSAHKYDTEDYFQIDPSFGTNAEFKAMVEACHEAGIKVMLDGVFNHCGWEHPFFQDVLHHGKKSKYHGCFFIDGDRPVVEHLGPNGRPKKHDKMPNYKTFAMTPVMPKWNTSDPIAREYLISVGTHWVKEYDIDGWRLDVSNEVSHRFWRSFRDAVRAVKKDVYLIGENWDDANAWLMGDQFDAVMNYEVSYPIWNFFGPKQNESIDGIEFVQRISRILTLYPRPVASQMFNLLSSHDTMRLLTRFEGNKERFLLAYFFLFLLCGCPSIYYGDEIGMEGAHDPDSRRCMIWDKQAQDRTLFDAFRALIAMRKGNPDLHRVDIEWIHVSKESLVFCKGSTFVAIHTGESKTTIPLSGKSATAFRTNGLAMEPISYQINP
jgi:glycosidase